MILLQLIIFLHDIYIYIYLIYTQPFITVLFILLYSFLKPVYTLCQRKIYRA